MQCHQGGGRHTQPVASQLKLRWQFTSLPMPCSHKETARKPCHSATPKSRRVQLHVFDPQSRPAHPADAHAAEVGACARTCMAAAQPTEGKASAARLQPACSPPHYRRLHISNMPSMITTPSSSSLLANLPAARLPISRAAHAQLGPPRKKSRADQAAADCARRRGRVSALSRPRPQTPPQNPATLTT